MRIFSSLDGMAPEVERELYEMGIRGHAETYQDKHVADDEQYEFKELLGYGYQLVGFDGSLEMFKFFGLDPMVVVAYCEDELSARFASISKRHRVAVAEDSRFHNPGLAWAHRPEVWDPLLEANGKFSYTYSGRIMGRFEDVVAELRARPHTRQAVVQIYLQHIDQPRWGGQRRIPCSMHYQFLLRDVGGHQGLVGIYVMRSCDLYTHFPLDVWLAVKTFQKIAWRLNVPLHSVTHFIGSLHAFRKDWRDRRIF